MAQQYDLHHWDNSRLKTLCIVILGVLTRSTHLVYNRQGQAVATFQVQQQKSALRFSKLATDPSFAGQGIGTACLDAIERMAASFKCDRVCMEVYDRSQHARRFYENRGYVVCGETHTRNYTELRMEKQLEK